MNQIHKEYKEYLKASGITFIAGTWNFPAAIPVGNIVAALLSGQAVLFKPALESVFVGWLIVQYFWRAGIPKEVLQFIPCEDDVGTQIIENNHINNIILTGSEATATQFKKANTSATLTAETGGKNSIILTSLCDREKAIHDTIQSAFGFSGQKCSAASLLIVEADIYDDPLFKSQLKDAAESLDVGVSSVPSNQVIPLIRRPSIALNRALKTVDKGESWLLKPIKSPDNPHLYSPGIKWNVKEGSFMHQTELFGPVLSVIKAYNLDHAIEIANSTPYGLTAGLQSLDIHEQRKWTKYIQAGNLYINRPITGATVHAQPFGGIKNSQFGKGFKSGGPLYLYNFIKLKSDPGPTNHILKQSDPIKSHKWSLSNIPIDQEKHWIDSIRNYTHWAEQYQQKYDICQLKGQDNFRYSVPHKEITLRVNETDTIIDVLRIAYICSLCNIKLIISHNIEEICIWDHPKWEHEYPTCYIKKESSISLKKRILSDKISIIRFISPLPNDIKIAISQTRTRLIYEPVLSNGKFELLHYLQEKSLSHDYHRYGYLSTRKSEYRKD